MSEENTNCLSDEITEAPLQPDTDEITEAPLQSCPDEEDGDLPPLRPPRPPIPEPPPVRPNIPVIGTVLSIIVPMAVNLGLAFLLQAYVFDLGVFALFGILMGAYVFLRLRSIFIFFILLYQRFASNDLRRRCLFTPTCSNYAIMALKKYGVLIGGIKSVGRLLRCRWPNGGEDYP